MNTIVRFYLLLSIFLLAYLTPLTGQDYGQTIRGKILDKQTQSPLPGAIIQVLNLENKNAISSPEGEFKISDVALGRWQVKVTMLGYREIMFWVVLTAGKEFVTNIELEESLIAADEVVVTAEVDKTKTNNKTVSVSARSFSIEETSRYAGSRNDPARMAANFAGVSGANDSRNDIIIRGNSPLGVLWRLNGLDIPNPNHFGSLGSTGGPISILNNNTLSNSDFITSAFPAEYGNGTAGVFDLKMREGNNEKYEFLTQMGFNGFELGAEGPFNPKSKRSSFLLNYRYSTLGIFKALGINFGTGTAVPQYQDLTLKMDFATRRFGKFSVYGIGGLSYVALLSSDRKNDQTLYGYEKRDTYFRSNVGIAGINHTYLINSKSYTRFSIGTSGQANIIQADFVFDSVQPVIIKPNYRSNSYNIRYNSNFIYHYKHNAKNNFQCGVFADLISTQLNDSIDKNNGVGFYTLRNFKGNAFLMRTFINWTHKFTENLTLNSGIHYTHFTLNNTWSVEPRAGIKWQIHPKHAISLGTGIHSQLQPTYIYFSTANTGTGKPVETNRNLDLMKSIHAVAGYDVNIGQQARIKSEIYYQYLYQVPVKQRKSSFSALNLGADFESPNIDSLVSTGTGENYGLELTIEKFYSKGYYFLITGSLFQSYYYGSDGIKRNTAFNGNYVANALAGKEIKLNAKWLVALDLKLTLAGGKRYTPINLAASQLLDTEVKFQDQAFSKQYPEYFRMDIKPSVRRNFKKSTIEINCDFQNVTRHDNIFQQVYDPATKQIKTDYQLKFFFVPQFRMLF